MTLQPTGLQLGTSQRGPRREDCVYGTDQVRGNLWMLQGYRQPGLWNQIKDSFRFNAAK